MTAKHNTAAAMAQLQLRHRHNTKSQLPKNLRGWLFLERAAIPGKECSGILDMHGAMLVVKLKKVVAESLDGRVLSDIDGTSHEASLRKALCGTELSSQIV